MKIAALVLMLVLAMVLAITLAVATPVLADTRIPGYPDFTINNRGIIIEGGDAVLGKCTTLLNQWDELSTKGPRYERLRETARACEKAERSGLLAKTGGLPVILLPIALLVVGGLLIRKATA